MFVFGPNFYELEKRKDFVQISKYLKNKKASIRKEAFKILFKYYSELNPDIIITLKDLTRDPDPSVRIVAVLKLANLSSEEMSEELYEELQKIIMQGSQKNKLDAIRLIVQNHKSSNEKISNILILSLNDKIPLVQIEAIKALGEIKEKLSLPHLIDKLNDKRKAVRLEAVKSLGKIGDKSSVEHLIASLTDEDEEIRLEARNSLALIGSDRAMESLKDELMPLIKLMNQGLTKKLEIIEYIGKNKLKKALPLLYSSLRDEYKNVRIASLQSIGLLRDISSVSNVINMLDDKYYDVRMEAAAALGKMNHLKALEALESAFNDKNNNVVEQAKKSYYTLQKRLRIMDLQN